jgi:hypothetical protein
MAETGDTDIQINDFEPHREGQLVGGVKVIVLRWDFTSFFADVFNLRFFNLRSFNLSPGLGLPPLFSFILLCVSQQCTAIGKKKAPLTH